MSNTRSLLMTFLATMMMIMMLLSMSTSVTPIEAQNQLNSNLNSSFLRTLNNTSDKSTGMFKKLIDSACNITNTNKDQIVQGEGFLTYLNPYYGIIMQYPSDWIYKESQVASQNSKAFSIVTFSPPLSSDPNAETNFKIWIENLNDPDITLDEYTRNVIKSYRENNSNFKLLLGTSTNSTISDGSPAYDVVFTDYSDNLRRKSFETGTLSNVSKDAYYITFNTDASLYDKFNPIVKQMIDSFGLYDYRLSGEERSKTYVQGYNDGLEFMVRAVCQSSINNNASALQ
jgi:hypothetical protein